ncbi:type IV secretory system conjugative DNA transfer family protein [Sulfitobacter sp. M22298]
MFLNLSLEGRTPVYHHGSALVCWGEVMAHRYIVGRTGQGKSSLIKQLIIDDMKAGHAVCFIDPHGTDTDDLLFHVPKKRLKDTVLFDLSDTQYVFQWNPLAESDNVSLTSTTLANAVKTSAGFAGSSTAQMSMFLEAIFTTLIQNNLPLSDALTLLDNPSKTDSLILKRQVLKSFWDKYEKKTDRDRDAANNSTYNKFFGLLIDERMEQLFSGTRSNIQMSDIVRDKIFFVRLAQGQLGVERVSLVGSILLSVIHLACLRRSPETPFHLYIDEVHNFAAPTITEMLSGLRKFNVSVTVAHQNIDQLSPDLFSSLMGNVAHRHIFNVSPEDALRFQTMLKANALHENLDELPPYRYRTFPWLPTDSDQSTFPLENPNLTMPEKIRRHTRNNYCRPR